MNMNRREFLTGAALAAMPALAANGNAADAGAAHAGRIRIAHLTDPQLGFSRQGKTPAAKYAADLKRLERAIGIVNGLKPDLALVTGDVTNRWQDVDKDWPRLLKMFEVPLAVAPGNHDVGMPVKKEMYDKYMSVFGYDRKAFDVNGWRIIVGNTQFWRKGDLVEEQDKYEEWVKAELEKAKAYKGKVILVGHVPPFAHAFNERDSYENYPKAGREERLRMYRHAGADLFICGHTHRMTVHGYGTLTILNAETTSNNFDARPYGFRMFEAADQYDYSYKFVKV